VISPAFRNFAIRLKDGQDFTGVKVNETETEIAIGDAQGKLHVLRKDQIEEMHALELSLMPEGLENGLTDSEFVDLLGFLADQK